ncbi:MAG: MAPEG family protein [Alphaproteobacteria bacterium]|nr:MAPEG family protein [Alphaproteobacteria bacterium]
MSPDLWALAGAVVLGFAHITAQSLSYKAQVTHAFTQGPREAEPAPVGAAGRYARAMRNFQESFALFAASVLLVQLAGEADQVSAIGAVVYLAARALYLPAYGLSLQPWRSIFWLFSMIAILAVLSALFV